ncbi:MAG: thymidine kinase [Cytophagales bacterium]|nr:thymidine kinase [Cytophagales bacterium]MDW8385030.1 thymidine kinase [Flammeovirgaceae bacterium]
MFLEPQFHRSPRETHTGWIEVICGSMFSGKTEELIRRVKRAIIAKQKVKIVKPILDTRYHQTNVVSHNSNYIEAIPVEHSKEILSIAKGSEVIGIDEAQFFDNHLTEICIELANQGKRVIVSGLDMDFEGNPFGQMPYLMSIAEFVTKLHAICARCGNIASYSFRLSAAKEKVLLGEKNEYEPRCRRCFLEGMQQRKELESRQLNIF